MSFHRVRTQLAAAAIGCLLCAGASAATEAQEEAATAQTGTQLPGLWSRPIGTGDAQLRLIGISADLLMSVGSSTATDDQLELLQAGGHDPRQRGFNLQQFELGITGAVDPYFTAEVYVIYFLDTDNESQVELEEAFFTTQALPHGLQIEGGQFFTEYGRINPQHPHQWQWQDVPVVQGRFFGEDGMRNPGVRLGWLTPLPWFSEVHLGVQDADGETMQSFLANRGAFDDRKLGGRPFVDRDVRSLADFTYLTRWVNAWDWSDSWSSQLGFSALFGPNSTGGRAKTRVYGTDFVAKWRPEESDRGWPFVVLQTELSYRDYEAEEFVGDVDGAPVFLPKDTLKDWGLYVQGLWGFRRNWAVGLRYDYASASEDSFDRNALAFVSHNDDNFRSTRHRVSPLLMWQTSEFARLRLQYNYDDDRSLDDDDAHSVWFGVEVSFGAHSAHKY